MNSDKEGIIPNLYTPQAIWGRELRHHRKAAGLTQSQLAERIHYSESLISGIETGQIPSCPDFAERCDELLETGGLLSRLLDWRKGQVFPSWFESWPDREQAATVLRTYEPILIPGLLQTSDYALEVLYGDETAVQARLERQKVFEREDPAPPLLRCVIDEAVLHHLIGTPKTMREQLEHLTSIITPRFSVQVVPFGGMRAGLEAGFVIATLEDGGEIAYFDTAVRGLVTSDQEDVRTAVEKFEAIRIEALPLRMSIDLIRRITEEKWT
ncbi:helix-turn-helix transcriptional regulator [Streptosporangium sp. NPDC006930]|uniref:helix-turn-helix domain-containing protein n=1 Tax=Streptosporangium sp. NPDC006930 TaxID=3154783 RepID=UPI00342AE3DC